MKRNILWLLLSSLVVVALLLSGCGPKPTEAPAEPAAEEPAAPEPDEAEPAQPEAPAEPAVEEPVELEPTDAQPEPFAEPGAPTAEAPGAGAEPPAAGAREAEAPSPEAAPGELPADGQALIERLAAGPTNSLKDRRDRDAGERTPCPTTRRPSPPCRLKCKRR